MAWMTITPFSASRVDRCDYCGTRKQLHSRVSDNVLGDSFEALICFDCYGNDRDALQNRIALPLVRWARERSLKDFDWREIRGAIHGNFDSGYRVGEVTLEHIEGSHTENGDLYAGPFSSPLERQTVIYWARI